MGLCEHTPRRLREGDGQWSKDGTARRASETRTVVAEKGTKKCEQNSLWEVRGCIAGAKPSTDARAKNWGLGMWDDRRQRVSEKSMEIFLFFFALWFFYCFATHTFYVSCLRVSDRKRHTLWGKTLGERRSLTGLSVSLLPCLISCLALLLFWRLSSPSSFFRPLFFHLLSYLFLFVSDSTWLFCFCFPSLAVLFISTNQHQHQRPENERC